MPSARMRVVVTRRLPAPVEARMQELFDVTLNADDRPMTAEELARAMAEADVLVPTITDRIDARLLAQAGPDLRLIANYGAGFDHIDVATALQRGIMVSNTPGVLAEDTADMAMALILAVPRRAARGRAADAARRVGGLEPDRADGPPHRRQAPRHPRPRPHRPRHRPAGAHLRARDPLPQPPAAAPRHRGRARRHLVGEPRPDAGAHRHPVDQRAAHALDLPPDERPAAEADEARPPTSSTPPAAR